MREQKTTEMISCLKIDNKKASITEAFFIGIQYKNYDLQNTRASRGVKTIQEKNSGQAPTIGLNISSHFISSLEVINQD